MFTLNVPNALTVLRILLVPVLVVALVDETSSDWLAAGVFGAASLPEPIDGSIARSRKQVTTFGKLMDPVADKLLIIAALVVLVSLHRIPAWIAVGFLSRGFRV